jgi:polysaccharide pyruvyl transferase WcaK-like protein
VPTALLAGAFGQRNPGDEALLRAFVDALPGWSAIVPAANPAAVADRRVRAVRAGASTSAAALLGADALVLAGGTVFKTLDPATGRAPHALLGRAVALTRAARLLGRPVALVGVGAGNLPGRRARALARALASGADKLVLRDQASAQLLAAAGVPEPLRVGADAAWTLFGRTPSDGWQRREGASARGPVVVTVSRHAGGGGQVAALATGLAGLLTARPDPDGVVIEPWQVGGPGRDDLDLARELQRALHVRDIAATIVPPPVSVTAASEGYRAARLVVGQRFHSLVAAAAAGTRFVAVAHEAKCADLAERLGQRSLPPSGPVAEIAPTLDAALAGPPPPSAAVAELTASAEAMLALMRTVLERGRVGVPADLRALHLQPEALIR